MAPIGQHARPERFNEAPAIPPGRGLIASASRPIA